jgi:hypothetical protein
MMHSSLSVFDRACERVRNGELSLDASKGNAMERVLTYIRRALLLPLMKGYQSNENI